MVGNKPDNKFQVQSAKWSDIIKYSFLYFALKY